MNHKYKACVKLYSCCSGMHLYAATRGEEDQLKRRTTQRNVLDFRIAAWLLILLACVPSFAQNPATEDVRDSLRKTKELMQVPVHVGKRYDYIMTGRVRLLLFWVGKDDVGGGYIRRGTLPQDPSSDVIELLIGSDPAKAPRAINRWGAASEIFRKSPCCARSGDSSVFFGFMKVSSGTSAAEMEKELAQEKQGGAFLFSAIINQGDRSADFAKVVPISSDTDFTINQFDLARSMVFDRLLGSQGRVKEIVQSQIQGCGRPEGFLETVAELIDDAVRRSDSRTSLCYFYNGDQHRISLTQVAWVPRETVKLSLRDEPHAYVRSYSGLVQARFEDINLTNNGESQFELLLGTTGALKGVPVQIRYQPNWWFQAILNLKTPEPSKEAQNR